MQRISWPDEPQREAAVRNFRRVIQLAVELGIPVINTEFSGRPDRSEDSEAAFYRSMEELLPLVESEGLQLNIDPHPDDFVEDGLEAWRVLRGLNSPSIGFVYVASHTFHYGDRAETLLPELGDRLGAVYAADTFDHRRSHGLRYISNPPGNAARIHQHLTIGDGDVDFEALFGLLRSTGYLDREDALVVSNVFAEDENADEVSRHQLARLRRTHRLNVSLTGHTYICHSRGYRGPHPRTTTKESRWLLPIHRATKRSPSFRRSPPACTASGSSSSL